MGRLYDTIEDRLRVFIEAQPVFFVATAPSGPDGHVNTSPKGMRGTFTVVDAHTVAYLDYTGSGAETIAHVRDNGRITLMFCAFTGPPKIVRLYGRGECIRTDDPRFAALRGGFEIHEEHGQRSIILVTVDRISDSCGYSVPLMEYVGERNLLTQWASHRTDDDLAVHREKKNAASIDGLPALA